MFSFEIAIIIVVLIAWAIISVLLAMGFRVVVATNEVHIVQPRRKTTSFGKDQPAGNSYYAWPAWMPRIGIRIIKLPVSVFDVQLQNTQPTIRAACRLWLIFSPSFASMIPTWPRSVSVHFRS
jgi:hypothetical protein